MRFTTLIFLSGLLLSGCGQHDAPHGEAAIRFAVAQMPVNLDPRYAADAASERINRLIYQPLVDFDAAAKPVPVLADWHEISPGQYRFILKRPLAKFHDGTLLTAEDVAATYQSLLQLTDSPIAAEFGNIDAIRVLNDNQLDFVLKQPDAYFLSRLILGILPARLIRQSHDFSRQPVGSGPLQFQSWNKTLLLKRLNDDQRIEIAEVRDPTVRVLKLLRGEVDLLQGDLPPELVKYLQRQQNLTVQSVPGNNYSYLGLNMQDQYLRQHAIRLAIAHAIDREAIIRQLMVSGTRVADSILPPEHYVHAGSRLSAYSYNPEHARQLLINAGVSLPLKLVYKTSTDAQRLRLATVMQSQMAKAGIELQISSLDWGTFFEDIKKGNFQMYGLTWVGIRTPEIYSKVFGSDNLPPKGLNRARYQDSELDALLEKHDWQRARQRIHDQQPYIPLWYEGQFVAYRNHLSHYSPKPDGNWDDLAYIQSSATIGNHVH